jgi:hypothetical protein
MRAAASLSSCWALARTLVRAGASQLMDQVAQAIEQFEIDARASGAPNDQIETANMRSPPPPTTSCKNLPTADSRV